MADPNLDAVLASFHAAQQANPGSHGPEPTSALAGMPSLDDPDVQAGSEVPAPVAGAPNGGGTMVSLDDPSMPAGSEPAAPAPMPSLDAPQAAPAPEAGPTQAQEAPEAPGMPQLPPKLSSVPILDEAEQMGLSAAAGTVQGVFHTYDFFTGGEPAEDQKSSFRRGTESLSRQLGQTDAAKSSGVVAAQNSLASGLGEFLPGLIAADGLGAAMKGLPLIGRGLAWATGKLGESAKAVLKTGAAGGMSLDPHAENFVNLVDTYAPALSNPLTNALAAHPDDGEVVGRLKNSLTSMGLDAVVRGAILGATAILRARSAGIAVPPEVHEEVAGHHKTLTEDPRFSAQGSNDNAPSGVPGAANDDAAGIPGQEAPRSTGQAPLPLDAPAPLLGEQMDLGLAQSAQQYLETASQRRAVTTVLGDRGSRVEFGPEVPKVRDTLEQGPQRPAPGTPEEAAPGAAPGSETTRVPSVGEAGAPPAAAKPTFAPIIDEASLGKLIDNMGRDTDAFVGAQGSWSQASGDRALNAVSLPWQKLASPEDVQRFMQDGANAQAAFYDRAKGGSVETDQRAAAKLAQRITLYNEDPKLALAIITQAGDQAKSLRANMDFAYTFATRALMDTKALAQRIQAGPISEYGSRQEAMVDFGRRFSIAQTALSSAKSISSNAGRALRGMRGEFAVDPVLMATLGKLDPEVLLGKVNLADGLQDIARLGTPGFLARLIDPANAILVNGMLMSPVTHYVGAMTNAFVALSRPAERIIGSLGARTDGAAIRTVALRQYGYTAGSIMDALRVIKQAFVDGDSCIAPHADEARNLLQRAGGGGEMRVPWDQDGGLNGAVKNGLTAAGYGAMKVVGLPTRALGAVDESFKMLTYRSMVMAKASVEGAEEARKLGLLGQDSRAYVANYVKQKASAAFDENGFATDRDAQQEAMVATFNQPLLGGTLGKGVQNLSAAHPGMRFLLPFVRTPTNILRMAWRYTPILDLAQTEYRQAVFGRLGPDAQAQAIGQMALGTLAMSSAGVLAAQGLITGGPPGNPQAAAQLRATGWMPYSWVSTNADGSKTYTNYGKYDPISTVFGMAADLYQVHQSYAQGDQEGIEAIAHGAAAGALALAKAVANKSYLLSLVNAMDAISGHSDYQVQKELGQTVNNYIPFSSARRYVTNTMTDGYLRDARSWVDQIVAGTPGLSTTIPPRRNWLGEPMMVSGTLMNHGANDLVDRETQRLIMETGQNGAVALSPPASTGLGSRTDLRQIDLKDGRNAYDVYQDLAMKPPGAKLSLREVVAKVMGSKAYAQAVDGARDVQGTKLGILQKTIQPYRDAAAKIIKSDPNVAAALIKDKLAVDGAIKAKQRDPSGAANAAGGLEKLGKAFGADLTLPHP